MLLALLSAGFQSLPLLPTVKLGPSSADSQVGGLVHALGPCGSFQGTLPVSLGVSPTAASTTTGVFTQWFEALCPHTGTPGWVVCFAPQLFLPVYLHSNVGPPALLVATSLGPPATTLLRVLASRLPVSALPACLDECVFFNCLVVGLPYSGIFCQFWLFLSFFWLCEEAQCVYLCLHLGWKPRNASICLFF